MDFGLYMKILFQWIFSTWTPNFDIYLFSKGFFIVEFETQKDLDFVVNEGPWFWGKAEIFISPRFSEFDATTMVVSTMRVWVRLLNIPLPFWHHKFLEEIWNNLGKFKK